MHSERQRKSEKKEGPKRSRRREKKRKGYEEDEVM